jgi:RimJ/RimL family protein N-acetyltransferase
MARIGPITCSLKPGVIVIRSASAADAAAIIGFNRAMTDFEFSVVEADESSGDVRAMERELASDAENPQHLRLLAEHDGGVVGTLDFSAPSKRRIRHRGMFGIAVARDWRGRGVGTALIRTMIDWARAHRHIEKIRLGVLGDNHRAIELYRRLGFEQEARRAAEFKLPGGRYCDDIMMCLWVKPRPTADS